MLKSSPSSLCYRSLLRSTLLFTPLKDLAVEKVFAEKIPRSHDHVHCRLWGISSLFRRVVSANFRPPGCRSFYLPIAYTIYPGRGSGLWYYLRPRKGLKTISLAETEFCKEDSFLCIFFFSGTALSYSQTQCKRDIVQRSCRNSFIFHWEDERVQLHGWS